MHHIVAVLKVTYTDVVQVAEVAASPAAEACWYFPNSREQYRIAGTLTIVDDQHPSQQLQKVGDVH